LTCERKSAAKSPTTYVFRLSPRPVEATPGSTADNRWVITGPHIMLLQTDVSQLEAYPTDWTNGGPWVMWKGTPYAPHHGPDDVDGKTGIPSWGREEHRRQEIDAAKR